MIWESIAVPLLLRIRLATRYIAKKIHYSPRTCYSRIYNKIYDFAETLVYEYIRGSIFLYCSGNAYPKIDPSHATEVQRTLVAWSVRINSFIN